jgi:hypothetical protein
MRILTFSDFRGDSNPLYANLKILKLTDQIALQNCLFVHDSLNKLSPNCFQAYFKQARDIHSLNTRNSRLGCLHVPSYSTIRYGLCSITKACISNWNTMTQNLNLDLLSISRNKLKCFISLHFTQSYN